MDFFMGIILILALVYLFFQIRNLSKRIKKLEAEHLNTGETTTKNKGVEMKTALPTAQALTEDGLPKPKARLEVAPTTATLDLPKQPPTEDEMATEPEVGEDLWRWFKEHTLIKIGAILFFLGAVWFVSYAVSEGWINPTMRILLGFLLGIVVNAIGHSRHTKSIGQYLTLTALGGSIIIASVFAGQFLFSLFAPILALMLLLIAIAYTIYVSLKTKTEWLTVVGAIAGLIAPLLINSPDPDAILFFAYLFALSLAFLVIVFTTGWRLVTLILLLGVLGFQLLFTLGGEITDPELWVFVLMFSTLFYSAVTVSLVRSKRPVALDITTLGITAISLVIWTNVLGHDGVWVLGYALVTAITGSLIYTYLRHKALATIYTVFTLLFIITATTMAFSGFTLTIAYTLEATALIALAIYLRLPRRNCIYASLIYLLPIISSFVALGSSSWRDGALHPDAYSLYLIIVSTFSLATLAIHLGKLRAKNFYLRLGGVFLTIGYGYTLVTLFLVWAAVLGREQIDDISVAVYLSWTVVIIALTLISLKTKLPTKWITLLLVSLALPISISISSLVSNDWATSITHNHALSIYTLVILLTLLTLGLRCQLNRYQALADYLKTTITTLWVVIGAYLTALVWLIPNAVLTDDGYAVTVSLLIYTISGLLGYSLGRVHSLRALKIGGIVLLAGVIARLGLVDVWQMELFWRIITFFGVGTLFIVAALLEKPFTQEPKTED